MTTVLLTDEELVADAIAAREEAESVEENVSPSRWREADRYTELSERGWTQQRIAGACGTNQASVSIAIRAAIRYLIKEQRPTFWQAYAEVTGENVHHSSASAQWNTPPEVIGRVLETLGDIDLDPCSNPGEPNVPARRHFTEADDGLAHPWHGRVYMNPPYGDVIKAWVQKLAAEFESGRVTEAIALVPARTDTAWFRELPAEYVCFWTGRLRFSEAGAGAPFPSAVFYLGPRPERFVLAFGDAGLMYRALDAPLGEEAAA
jgi:phage N-6-adenine-methyltransferase